MKKGELWSGNIENLNLTTTATLDKKILQSDNPYKEIRLDNIIPEEKTLLAASAFLQLRPELLASSKAYDIALREFQHFAAQTYYFEALGIQIMSAVAVNANSLHLLHHVAAQLIDEARHTQVYGAINRSIDHIIPFSPSVPTILESIASAYSLEEQLVKAFVILESIAVGIFTARCRLFEGSQIAKLDRLLLQEESEHQSMGLSFIMDAMKAKKIDMDKVKEIVRTESKNLFHSILPTHIADEFSLKLSEKDLDFLRKAGITGAQIPVTTGRIRRALTQLMQAEKKSK